MFLMTVGLASSVSELLVPAIIGCPQLKSLFSQDELLSMWPQYEEARGGADAKPQDSGMTGAGILVILLSGYCYLSQQLHKYCNKIEKPICSCGL